MSGTKKLTLAAMCLCLGVILPQAFHGIPAAGSIFLPMHIPVLIAGFICGPLYGLIVGFTTPIVSHLLFSMPLVSVLGQMILELSIYGLMSGILNNCLIFKNELLKYYFVLMGSMLSGRIIYGLANAFFFKAGSYSFKTWLATAFITALPGIIIQLLIIPILVKNIKKILS